MMVTTIIALVFFTVFIQGMTIGPLVRILNVPTSNKMKPSMNERILTRSMDHLMAGIEDIVGQHMGNHHLRDKFKYYNNKYLRPVLTREHGSAEPKIFETYSKLNLADAMNLVKQNGNLVPVIGGENNGMSLSSLFRSYTQAQMDKPLNSENRLRFPKSALPRNDSSFLNVDIGELEYSPSHKDLADAELHHILSDAMFKPPRRHRSLNKNHIFTDQKHSQPFRHQMRMQIRHLVSEHCHNSRRRSDNCRNGQSHGIGAQQDGESSPASSESTHNELLKANKKKCQPPPVLRFSVPDEPPEDWGGTPTPMPTQTGAALQEPVSAYSSLMELSSSLSHEDDCIMFVADGKVSPIPGLPDDSGCPKVSQRSPTLEPKTITETTLPWKRHESFSDTKCARKQQEFPSWIENRDYLLHGSPTNTLLQRLGGTSTPRRSAPAVFDVFHNPHNNDQEDAKDTAAGDATCAIDDETSIRVQIESGRSNPDTKDVVVINMKPNASDSDENDDDMHRFQATRL